MGNPNATKNDFSIRHVTYQVSSNMPNDEEQTKVQFASSGKELKNFAQNYRNTKLTHRKSHDNPTLIRKADKMPQDSAITAAPTDTVQGGVERKSEKNKSREYGIE